MKPDTFSIKNRSDRLLRYPRAGCLDWMVQGKRVASGLPVVDRADTLKASPACDLGHFKAGGKPAAPGEEVDRLENAI